MSSRIGAALLGTGLFAKDVYKGNFKDNASEVELKVVWSRTMESAQSFVGEYSPASMPLCGEEGLKHILEDASIQLVVLVLPVPVALPMVERCLAAGKAVVSEKPVAGTVAAAQAAIKAYRALLPPSPAPGKGPVWMFAENYRYETVFHAAVSRLPDIGRIIKLDLIADLPMDARNKYHSSEWRRDTAQCPGGFLMDSAVHFVSALRLLANKAGAGEAVSVSAHGLQAKPDLSFPDSVVGVALFSEGVPAAISISLAAHHVRWSLSVVGVAGTLEISRGGWGGSRAQYTLNVKAAQAPAVAPPGQDAADPTLSSIMLGFRGCQDEFADFLGITREVVLEGKAPAPGPEHRSSPEEGARDLALIEALLASVESKGQAVPVVQI